MSRVFRLVSQCNLYQPCCIVRLSLGASLQTDAAEYRSLDLISTHLSGNLDSLVKRC